MAAKGEAPEPFGIRRRLTHESETPILETFRRLVQDGEIPDTVIPRPSLHVTEMPKTKLGAQLNRGIVLGYEFDRKAASIRHEIKEDFPYQLEVRLGAAAIFKHRNLGYKVESEDLELEYYGVRQKMGRIGIKGAMRDVEPLHVTCGDVKGHLTRHELFRTLDVMNSLLADTSDTPVSFDELTVAREATLEPVDFYPREYAA
ncbi:hypothetical protein H0X10_02215 [Candidatus Saccharibacteria bacterium]|nr:hypothetical protein [Candidatus Saccharibacteria bacterium]